MTERVEDVLGSVERSVGSAKNKFHTFSGIPITTFRDTGFSGVKCRVGRVVAYRRKRD